MALDSRSTHLLEDLLEMIVSWDGMPVRPMEEVLVLGPDAVPAVAEALEEYAEEPDGVAALWLLVLLGRSGDPAAVEPLLEWIGDAGTTPSHRHVAAEGLARIGEPALPALLERLDGGAPEDERLWIYAALGSMEDVEGAHDRLAEALETDPPLIDVIATALVQWKRPEDVPGLAEALRRCEPWQRLEVEEAIRSLHHGVHDEPGPEDRDWRLRFRIHPVWETVEPSWSVVAAVAREERLDRERAPLPVRPLEDILADPPPLEDGIRYCDECGEPMERPTGLWVCPETAAVLPMVQHDFLGQMREEEGLEDLFDLLDVVEADEMELREAEPRGRRARERWEMEVEELEIMRGTCRWAIGEGIERVGPARARLLAEAERLRAIHGDPRGLLSDAPPPGLRDAEPGRNDPCPCGSGRKYKKCCGRPGTAAAGGSPRLGGGRPELGGGGPELGGGGLKPEGGGPKFVTREGEELVFGRAHYHVSDGAEVRRRLAARPDFDDPGPGEPLVWLRSGDEDDHQVLGSVRIEGDRLVLECMSMERLERGSALIESVAGGLVTHRTDTVEDPWQTAAARLPGSRPRPEPSDLPPEVEEEAVRKVLDRHYRAWPDEPVPALGGRTPREAVKTRAGRRQVADLLRSYEERPAGSAGGRSISYDFGWLWEELGIEELRR